MLSNLHIITVKTKENFTLLTLKVVANAYEMWLAEFQISAQSRVKKTQLCQLLDLTNELKINNDLVGTVEIALH